MKHSIDLPYMSIVVVSYNGSATIARTLDSLLNQDYPTSKYEVIVVDDDSTDNTGDIVKSYPAVRYNRIQRSKTLTTVRSAGAGIATVRNAGIAMARGDIYVSFDDDCVADRGWLTQLAEGYKLDNPAGVSGVLINERGKGILKQYIQACGSGPAPADTTSAPVSKTIWQRLATYLTNGAAKLQGVLPPYLRVQELYGANGSYPIEILRAVGGWRKEMSGIEDRDLSLRIRQQFPDKSFYAMRDAKVIDDPDTSPLKYFLRPYMRGVVNFRFHRLNHMLPPVFPYPFIYLGLVIVAALFDVRLGITAAIITPQILYFWWPLSMVKLRQPLRILFPYLQVTEETMVIAGLLRGALVVYTQEKRA